MVSRDVKVRAVSAWMLMSIVGNMMMPDVKIQKAEIAADANVELIGNLTIQAPSKPALDDLLASEIETEIEPEEETTEETFYGLSDSDKETLARIAMAEAEECGVYGKALVIAVVLNRVESDEFPDTVRDVVYQENQFTSVSNESGRYYTKMPDSECYEAVELVCSGWDESNGALYFESCTGSSWQSRNLTLLFQYGKHKFYS